MNPVQIKQLLDAYSSYLSSLGLSSVSVKNYRSDIKSFLVSTSSTSEADITSHIISSYSIFIRETLKPQIYKRKASALHHLARFLHLSLQEPEQSFSKSFSSRNFPSSFAYVFFGIVISGVVFSLISSRQNRQIPSEYITRIPSGGTSIGGLQAKPIVAEYILTLTNEDAPDMDQDMLVELLRTSPELPRENELTYSDGRCDFIYKRIKLDSLFQKTY